MEAFGSSSEYPHQLSSEKGETSKKKSEQRKVIYDPQMNSNANRKQIRVDVGIGRACTVRDHEVPMALT